MDKMSEFVKARLSRERQEKESEKKRVRRDKIRKAKAESAKRKTVVKNNIAKKATKTDFQYPAYRPHMGVLFYDTREWREVRWKALKAGNGRCAMCGNTAITSGKPLHVDHIKPRSQFPELELIPANLQVLCELCNIGKGATTWKCS
jgi:5-methylcytosine-specific restriction endonuclease McrA